LLVSFFFTFLLLSFLCVLKIIIQILQGCHRRVAPGSLRHWLLDHLNMGDQLELFGFT
jgi:uncharacterized membrane protein